MNDIMEEAKKEFGLQMSVALQTVVQTQGRIKI